MIKTRYVTFAVVMLLVLLFLYMVGSRQERTLSIELVPTAEYLTDNPVPFPSFIGSVSPASGGVLTPGEKMCVRLFPGELMNAEDSYVELNDHIVRTASFLIDNLPLPLFIPIDVSMPGGMREIVYGQETGATHLCFPMDFLERGLHLAEMRLQDLNGTDYSYVWSFWVN